MKNQYIAVVGMAAKFPHAKTISSFWQNIVNGHCGIEAFSRSELEAAGVPQEYVSSDDYRPKSAVLEDIDKFDAAFFGINKRDAQIMDPQFRQFFEVAWWALEDAGLTAPNSTNNIGVYCSSGMSLYSDKFMNSYFKVNVQSNDTLMATMDPIQAKILTQAEYLPTQLSYKLNLTGPSLHINTACSSSLVTIHLAVQGLLQGQCEAALAGAAAIHAPHIAGYMYNQGSIFSADGVCRPFDANANGIVGGNGVGAVVLKTLEQAEKDQDTIYAIINATAINNDGSTKVSYTAPSVEGQKNNIVNALLQAKIDINKLRFIEAHGTGTALGDPVEVSALGQALKQLGHNGQKIKLGSVKANIGHLDTAAGIASFIKTVCAVHHGILPGLTNFTKPNPSLSIDKTNFELSPDTTSWEQATPERHALVAALGAGGTNAHIVVSGYQSRVDETTTSLSADEHNYVLFMSGFSEQALHANLEQMSIFLETSNAPLADICYSAACKRAVFAHRCLVIGKNKAELIKHIRQRCEEKFFKGYVKTKRAKTSWSHYSLDSRACLYDLSQLKNLEIEYCEKGLLPHLLYQQVANSNFSHVRLPQYCFDQTRHWVDFQSNITANKISWIHCTKWCELDLAAQVEHVQYEVLSEFDEHCVEQLTSALNEGELSGLAIYSDKFELSNLNQQLVKLAKLLVNMEQQLAKEVKLVLLTTNAVPVLTLDKVSQGAVCNAIWSGLKVACHEMLNLSPIWLDVEPSDTSIEERVSQVIIDSKVLKGDELAFRGRQLYRQQMQPLPQKTQLENEQVDQQSLQILLGGNGGIGWQLITKLAQQGFTQLLVVSRREIDAQVESKLAQLKAQGCHVHWLAADATDKSSWLLLKGKLEALKLNVGCVYHMCGVLSDAMMSNLDSETFAAVTKAKIAPLIELENALTWLQPSRILLFSSLSAAFGTAGQYAYAVANGFLDGWAVEQRMAGINVVSLQWGPWQGGGMAEKTQEGGKSHHIALVEVVAINEAMTLIETCFAHQKAVYALANLQHLFASLPSQQRVRYQVGASLFSQQAPSSQTHIAQQQLSATSINRFVEELIVQFAGLESSDPKFATLTFSQLGIDSLGITRIRQLISSQLKTKMTVSELYSHPSVQKLQKYLCNKLLGCIENETKNIQAQVSHSSVAPFDIKRGELIEEICRLLA